MLVHAILRNDFRYFLSFFNTRSSIAYPNLSLFIALKRSQNCSFIHSNGVKPNIWNSIYQLMATNILNSQVRIKSNLKKKKKKRETTKNYRTTIVAIPVISFLRSWSKDSPKKEKRNQHRVFRFYDRVAYNERVDPTQKERRASIEVVGVEVEISWRSAESGKSNSTPRREGRERVDNFISGDRENFLSLPLLATFSPPLPTSRGDRPPELARNSLLDKERAAFSKVNSRDERKKGGGMSQPSFAIRIYIFRFVSSCCPRFVRALSNGAQTSVSNVS